MGEGLIFSFSPNVYCEVAIAFRRRRTLFVGKYTLLSKCFFFLAGRQN